MALPAGSSSPGKAPCSQKILRRIYQHSVMRPYKRIERCIALYIIPRYSVVVEVGVGTNFAVAGALSEAGIRVTCTDIAPRTPPSSEICVVQDDIFQPRESVYRGADLIYSIRPGVEMVPPMIRLAHQLDVDLLVYHLGNELYGRGGEVIECGVPLHRYTTGKKKEHEGSLGRV